MSRRTVAAAVAGLVAATAVVVADPQPRSAEAASTVVTLTSTRVVSSGEVIRNTTFVWNGPATDPVLLLKGTQSATLDHIYIEVPDGQHASAAIQLDVDPALGVPFGNHLRSIRTGKFYMPGNYSYGLRINSGTGNTVTNMTLHGAEVANVSLANTNARDNAFRNLMMIIAPVNFESRAAGMTVCRNCGFIGATDVDLRLTDGAGFTVSSMFSEQSRAFADIVAGPAGGGLTVLSGYWMWTPKAIGTTITGTNPNGHRTWLRLTDFLLTPIDSTGHGSFRGFAPQERFFSNVQGLTEELVAGRGTPGFSDWIYGVGSPGGAPPETTITNGPPAETTEADAAFSFTGTDDRHVPEDLRFECSLDGAAFTACASPKAFTSLPVGEHVFQVRAVDRGGAVDTSPAQRTWDVQAPTADGASTDAKTRKKPKK